MYKHLFAEPPVVGTEKPHHPYFYHLEIDGKSSYILGTIHSGDVTVSHFNPFLIEPLETASYLAVESIDHHEGFMPQKERPEDLKFFNEVNDPSWFDALSDVSRTKLLSFVLETTENKEMFDQVLGYLKSLKVGAAYTLVSNMINDIVFQNAAVQDATQEVQSSPTLTFDKQLVAIADEKKLPIAVLDSASLFYDIGVRAYTISDFDSLMIDAVESEGTVFDEYVDQQLKNATKADVLDEGTLNSYLNGTFERSLLRNGAGVWDKESLSYRWNRMVLSRHMEWAELIIKKMKQKSFFFALGLAHVQRISNEPEFEDIPRLLEIFEQNGVKVTKVDSSTVDYVRSRIRPRAVSCRGLL